jgi:hypothetical protein
MGENKRKGAAVQVGHSFLISLDASPPPHDRAFAATSMRTHPDRIEP